MNIGDSILKLRETIPGGVELVAVSKFHPNEAIMDAYEVGQRVFGESRATELKAKATSLPNDIQWHFIGHLQTNKVRQLVPFVNLIHSVDSVKLLACINNEAKRVDKVVNVLLQLHVAQEETKFGFTCDDCLAMVADGVLDELQNVRVCGVMGMASLTDDETKIRAEFKAIKATFERLKDEVFDGCDYFCEVSMGMSGDYPIAIEEGATIVRIGSSIFGNRNY